MKQHDKQQKARLGYINKTVSKERKERKGEEIKNRYVCWLVFVNLTQTKESLTLN